MKTKMIFCHLAFILFWGLCSCASGLLPDSTVNSKYFSITIPYNIPRTGGWTLINESDSGKPGEIWLQNGNIWVPGPADFIMPDYPVKNMLVLRKSIPDSLQGMDKKILVTRLIEIEMFEVRKIIDNLWSRFSLENFYYDSFKNKDYYQFHYSLIIRDTSTANGHLPFVDYYGDGIGQFRVYLPKSYNEYKTYYLFIYDVFLWQSLGRELAGFRDKFECVEDKIIQ